jgi:hypothetical protein
MYTTNHIRDKLFVSRTISDQMSIKDDSPCETGVPLPRELLNGASSDYLDLFPIDSLGHFLCHLPFKHSEWGVANRQTTDTERSQ